MKQAKNLPHANFFSRILAFVLDVLLVASCFLILFGHLGALRSLSMQIFALLAFWLYSTFMSYIFQATLAQKIVGIKVVNTAYNNPTLKQMFLRTTLLGLVFLLMFVLLRYVDFLAFSVDFMMYWLLLLPFLPFCAMFFSTKNQTLYDYMSNSILIDCIKENKKLYFLRKAFRIIGYLVIVGLCGYLATYLFVMGKLYIANKPSTSVDTTIYETVNYQNPSIEFYKKELETASKNFIEATSMYGIFHWDTRKELATNCISWFLRKEGHEYWIQEVSRYEKNANNLYATTKSKVKQLNHNNNYIGKNFYKYEMNTVHRIADEVADKWNLQANEKSCEKNLSTKKMYEIFILRYINALHVKRKDMQQTLKHLDASQKNHISFYTKSIQSASKWLKILHEKHPNFANYKYKQIAKKRLNRDLSN